MAAEGPLFFAVSDDEDEAMNIHENQAEAEARPLSPAGLFLELSDEDETPSEAALAHDDSNLIHDQAEDMDASGDVDIPPVTSDQPRSSSVTSISSSSSPATSPPSVTNIDKPSPSKKRRLSTAAPAAANAVFESAYLGSFLVGNAWSTARGKGYVKPGDEICVERDVPNETDRKLTKLAAVKPGAKAKAMGAKGKQKQLSIATLVKTQPPKAKKKDNGSVVRLTNKRGFEFGRLPQDVASWVSTLLDMSIVDFRGSTMIDCPTSLHSGADLIVSLSVYLRASAFRKASASSEESLKVMFNEGQESQDEQALRQRKTAILRLFDAVGLRPRRGNPLRRNGKTAETSLSDSELKQMSQHPKGSKPEKLAKPEIVGDGEEVEVEGEGEDLSEDQLTMIYNRAQKNDQTMQRMDPVDTFTLSLRGYQKQALKWMHSLETGSSDARELTSLHPLWNEYIFPDTPEEGGIIDLTADDQPFYFNPYSGELSLQFPTAVRKCRGGILADVGMGKTIMLSALIHTNREPEESNENQDHPAKRRQLKLNSAFRPAEKDRPMKTTVKSTLIVAPTSLLTQWSDELMRSSKPGTLKVIVWHGSNRSDLEAALDSEDNADVVITSYGVLTSEHAKSDKSSKQSPVFQTEWLRVILDEAHHCKSRLSKTARAVYALKARRRWAVTGTPIVNRLEDLFSLLKFLDFTPWSDYSFFRSFITLPFLARDPKAIEIVQVIMESILLRREKTMVDTDGKRIVDLPPKEVTVDKLVFTTAERKIYDSIYSSAKRNFEDLNARGLLSKNYTHILAMLMRLRRAVLHPSLVHSTENDNPVGDEEVDINAMIKEFSEGVENGNDTFAETVLNNLEQDDQVECPLCLDVMDTPVILPGCLHQCCKDCIVAYIAACEEKSKEVVCPTCSQGPIKASDLLEVVRRKKEDGGTDGGDGSTPNAVTLRKNSFRSSTKLEALLRNLKRLRDQDPCFRAVVFSQFTSFLDLIGKALQREKFTWYRFDGSMNVKKRNEAVAEFKAASRSPKVLIVSLKAGGVGLNLTNANHVFMMDCWWNAATESQAVDRVHRIGQDKTVYVTHFIVDNTIEGRILQIQKRKTALVKEAFRGTGDKDPDSLENLKIMFADE
ncbi:hypothetical protein GLOTRDRAFT_112995 [Gloeophyllum trabeum ATCC 11539]|uniref:DNA repair protein RAD5 n=1 Tax=Gloeophyllum trabeum (strain ATCC 11539 / FP-39264 / Madison 617) TaxID=670483 RepID=S7RZ97_GLOTA|nr:uncharacterized protein GLOTRDRAFT_112995 [Gloeophyllum trabeum ATCC 11539]EPQ60320.1 hypothetical protein GLOTRDRAFT_112995 [Gloeophyllum trabeum ATCC 11539]